MPRREEPRWPASRWAGPSILLLLLVRAPADAFVACDAQEIMAQEPGCPSDPSQPCNIGSTVTTPSGATCVFAFGARHVAIGGTQAGRIEFGSSLVRIAAASLTIHKNGALEGIGAGGQPGGQLIIETSGAMSVLGQGTQLGEIDVRGNPGGWVVIDAGGTVTMTGRIDASRVVHNQDSAGGTVDIRSAEDVVVGGVIAVIGGAQSRGGSIALRAARRFTTTARLNVSGGSGGSVVVRAPLVALDEIEAIGLDPGGSGADVTILGDAVALNGHVDLRGGSSQELEVYADRSITVDAPVSLDCTAACYGGSIDFQTEGYVMVGTQGRLSASTGSHDGYGGDLYIIAGTDVVLNGPLDVSGRTAGGTVQLDVGRDLTITAPVDASGSLYGGEDGVSDGGQIDIFTGNGSENRGHLTISARLDATAGGCLYGSPATTGGSFTIETCDLTVAAAGQVLACGGSGGGVQAVVRRQLTVAGEIRADSTASPYDGNIELVHPGSLPAVIAPGAISPSPQILLAGFCYDYSGDYDYYDECVYRCGDCEDEPVTPPAGPVIEACNAAEIMAQEPGCPDDPSLPCNILSTVVTPQVETCEFDFGERDLAIGSPGGAGGRLSIAVSDSVEIRAGSFTVHANGIVESVRDIYDVDRSAALYIDASGPVRILRDGEQNGLLDFTSHLGGGEVHIGAGGDITVDGRIVARQTCSYADYGSGTQVNLYSDADISVDGELVSTTASGNESYGGFLLSALEGRVEIGGHVELRGGFDEGPNEIHVDAREILLSGTIDGRATMPDFYSAEVMFHGEDITIDGQIDVRTLDVPLSLEIGHVALEAERSLRFNGSLLADVDGEPDYAILQIFLGAGDDLVVGPEAVLSVRALAPISEEPYGGTAYLSLEAGRDLVIGSRIDISGHNESAELSLGAGRHIFIEEPIDARSLGAEVRVHAGEAGLGNVAIRADVDTSPPDCGAALSDCFGGQLTARGCNLTVAETATLRSREISLTARHQALVEGDIDAGAGGRVEIVHAESRPPILSGSIFPAPVATPKPFCTGPGSSPSCLQPCPACSGGMSEYPWICPDDGLFCTEDSCGPEIGCAHERIEGCAEPTRTPTVTRTPRTPTPSRTPTASRTGTATATYTPTPAPCWGDCNGDGMITLGDVQTILGLVNRCGGNASGCAAYAGAHCEPADVDTNGQITAGELSRVLMHAALGCAQ